MSADRNNTYCKAGVRTWSDHNQQSAPRETLVSGTPRTARCKVQDSRSITSWAYNGNKTSTWWLQLTNGNFIPYAWFNLDGENFQAGDHHVLDKLPPC